MKMKSCSLTIVCVIVLVVILFMMFSGSKNNMYGLIEGMVTKKDDKNPLSRVGLEPLTTLIPGGALLADNPDENTDVKPAEKKENF